MQTTANDTWTKSRTALSEDDNEYDPEADEEDNPPRYPNDKEVVLHRLSVAVLGMH